MVVIGELIGNGRLLLSLLCLILSTLFLSIPNIFAACTICDNSGSNICCEVTVDAYICGTSQSNSYGGGTVSGELPFGSMCCPYPAMSCIIGCEYDYRYFYGPVDYTYSYSFTQAGGYVYSTVRWNGCGNVRPSVRANLNDGCIR